MVAKPCFAGNRSRAKPLLSARVGRCGGRRDDRGSHGDRLHQELHVIDLQTMNCVTLFSRPYLVGLLATHRRAICETHAAGFGDDERVGFRRQLTTRLQMP